MKHNTGPTGILLHSFLFYILQEHCLFFHCSLSYDKTFTCWRHHWDTEVPSNPIQPGIYTTLISLVSQYPTELHYH